MLATLSTASTARQCTAVALLTLFAFSMPCQGPSLSTLHGPTRRSTLLGTLRYDGGVWRPTEHAWLTVHTHTPQVTNVIADDVAVAPQGALSPLRNLGHAAGIGAGTVADDGRRIVPTRSLKELHPKTPRESESSPPCCCCQARWAHPHLYHRQEGPACGHAN